MGDNYQTLVDLEADLRSATTLVTQFIALHVLEGKLVAPTEGASIDKEDLSPRGVADVEVIAKRPEFLFQHVTHRCFLFLFRTTVDDRGRVSSPEISLRASHGGAKPALDRRGQQ